MSDTIDRQAAIDALDALCDRECEYSKKQRSAMCGACHLGSAFDVIEQLPSAQPEPPEPEELDFVQPHKKIGVRLEIAQPSIEPERKTGKWIEHNPQNSPDCRLIKCSECGFAYIVGYNIDYDDWIDGRNFCMKCGADMRGEEHEN